MLCLVRKRRRIGIGRVVAKVAVSKAIYAIDKPYDYQVLRSWRDRYCPGCGWPSLSGVETVGRMASCSPLERQEENTLTPEAGAVLS